MIGYLRGNVAMLNSDCCILDVNGVGYRVHTPTTTRETLKIGEPTELFIHTAVREDAILLYGFLTKRDYDAFNLLISVSGIGAKGALGILSAVTVDHLFGAISQKNITALIKLPGVGKKSAERLILELKDKVESTTDYEPVAETMPKHDGITSDTLEALLALGYQRGEAQRVIDKVKDCQSTEEAVRRALKLLSGK